MNQILLNWLDNNLIKRKSINYDYDTSQIRQAFEHDTHLNVTNDEVNDAVLQLGYKVANFAGDPYLHFGISSQSPALKIYRNEVFGAH